MNANNKKTKENHGHEYDWWELWPLTETTRRPLAWSRSSIIFTAHSTQAVVEAHFFPSGKPVIIPNPPALFDAYGAYKSPSVITLSPCDQWLFAYFPHRTAGGLGCLWKRGNELNRWAAHDCWSFAGSGGVVAASWAGGPREWATTGLLGSSTRLPLRGPPTPLSDPTLLIVTQSHELHICYYKPMHPLKIHRCSLTEPSNSRDADSMPQSDADAFSDAYSAGGARLCVNAAFGLGYNELSILIATRSQTIPTGPRSGSQIFDLNASFDRIPMTSDVPPGDWEAWSEEPSIALCEIKLTCFGSDLVFATQPLPDIEYEHGPLTELTFVSTPGEFRRDGSDGLWQPGTAAMHLVAVSCELGDGSMPPTSDISIFPLTRQGVDQEGGHSWISQSPSRRVLTSTIVAFVTACPAALLTTNGELKDRNNQTFQLPPVFAVGLLDATMALYDAGSTRRNRETRGQIAMLSMTDLAEDLQWEPSTMICAAPFTGTHLPLSFAHSPNGAVFCTAEPSYLPTGYSFHPLPHFRAANTTTALASSLIASMRGRRSPSDVVHVLSLPDLSIEDVQLVLGQAISFFDFDDPAAISNTWVKEVVGVAVEVYRTRAGSAKSPKQKEDFTGRWKTAHDLCSVIACLTTFERYKQSEGVYALGGVWQLINLSTWSINFLEGVVKDCIIQGDITRRQTHVVPKLEGDDDLFGSAPPTPAVEIPPTKLPRPNAGNSDLASEPSPSLLHIAHPYALASLQALLQHVRRLRMQVATSTASTEGAKIAQDVLVDVIACSGVDLDKFDGLLSEIGTEVKKLDSQQMLRSLSACRLVPELYRSVAPIVHKVASSPAIDKTRLFLKPADLADGFSDLRLSDNRDKKVDVVSKDTLSGLAALSLSLCVRCGGRSRGALSGAPICVCGGQWTAAP